MNKNSDNYDLEKRTTEFAKEVVRLCKRVPLSTITIPIIGQLVRASGSIGANYREANDALGRKDFAMRVKTARKEAKESMHWLDILSEACPQLKEEIDRLLRENIEIKNILSAIVQKVSN